MPAMRYCLDSPHKNQFIGAIQAGLRLKDAAELKGIPTFTAYDLLKKFCETGSTWSRSQSGQPSKLTDRDKRLLVCNARKNCHMPLRDLGKTITPQISETTTRCVLAKQGYNWHIARKVLYLRPEHRRARVQWTRENKEKDWTKVMWSDECYVYIGDSQDCVYVIHCTDEGWHENCVVPLFKQSQIRLMVWGCILEGRKGPLVILEYLHGKGGEMNTTCYQEQVLEAVLKDFYDEMKQERGSMEFQQDSAPAHTLKAIKQWFKEHLIVLFQHPASSPDLSAIEPLWHELKTIIHCLPHPVSSISKLRQAVLAVWEAIPIELINRQVRLMLKHVERCLVARGGHTSF
jgi:transposase